MMGDGQTRYDQAHDGDETNIAACSVRSPSHYLSSIRLPFVYSFLCIAMFGTLAAAEDDRRRDETDFLFLVLHHVCHRRSIDERTSPLSSR